MVYIIAYFYSEQSKEVHDGLYEGMQVLQDLM